ncbi:NUDIX domain-containing protein [Mucilaginibacter sp. BJC16-A38]|uniref:NUDIX domain-containing protein n=1 Tax=Mucilaginibacter phenanthrenivorans TaxID=1234842 RepID=UPI002157A526|nr:NUDIX domain-containing protein [Mucilaginibacter phenanthrenivorans]MCR8557967.1 NUDIX domain-containing protein [Mucilaginibacter phenanthrenivorans]
MASIQILNKETLSDKKYPLQYISFEKPDKEGVFHNHEREVYFRPDAVGVLLVDEGQRKILLTKQFRLPAFLNGSDSGYLVETCAGIIDENETPEQTAHREAEEETGYQIKELEKIASAYTSAGGITEFVHLFIANYISEKDHPKTGGLEGEDIQLIELGFDEAREKLKQGEFRDAKTIILLQHFFMRM